MTVPPWFWIVTAFLFGITVGSFLNVVIWRLPRNEALNRPQWSYCPHCKNRLTVVDLVPLVSFLALGRRCRQCKAPISWRYFRVELLTGLLFVALTLRFPHLPQDTPNWIFLSLFTAVLIPIYFIDLECFVIPNSLNLLAFVLAINRDLWGIAQQEPGHALLWGWLPRSVFGGVVGVLIFGTVRVLGWLWKRREAMGLGDPLLARAMGAMLVSVVPAGMHPLRLFPIWVLLSCLSGVLVGPALIWWRHREAARHAAEDAGAGGEREAESEEIMEEGDGSTLKQQLLEIGWCLWFGDAIEYVSHLVRVVRGQPSVEDTENFVDAWDDTPLAPSAIPFGPFLIIGFLATVFIGEALTSAYLAYALPKP